MEEIWKDIKDFEGLYQVSNLGNVKSLDRIIIQKNNGVLTKTNYKSRILKLQLANGYYRVNLSKNNCSYWKLVHRLVGEAFLPHKKENNIINHLDNNPKNNNVSNLEWTTYKGNMQYAAKQGRMKYKPNNLKKAQEAKKIPVIAIDKDGNEYEFSSQVEAANQLNCTRGHIASICKNRYGYKSSNGFTFRYKEENNGNIYKKMVES